MGWEKEFRTLQWFGLQDGMNILDAGCGPGFVTEKLIESLPGSPITALDIDGVLIDRAKARFLKKGVFSHHEFEQLKALDENFSKSSESYAMMIFLMACGTKPWQ